MMISERSIHSHAERGNEGNLLDILDNETIALKTGLSVSEVQSLRE